MSDMEIDDESPVPQYSDLLSAPGTLNFPSFQRIHASSLHDHFGGSGDITKDTEFNRQYAHTYFVRLRSAYPVIESKIKREWKGTVLKKIAELCETSSATYREIASPKKKGVGGATGAGTSSGKKQPFFSPTKKVPLTSSEHEQHIACSEHVVVAIIGTIFKQQPDKPSILQELVDDIKESTDTNKPIKDNYISDKDVVLLEDETTRVRLIPGKNCGITINGLVNGIICGVRGKPTIDGKFEASEVMWATPESPIWPGIKQCDPVEMVFISGLNFASDSFSIQMNLLFEHLQGISGSNYEQTQIIGKRTRVFFVGDTILPDASGPNRFKETAKLTGKLDHIFSELAKTMEVFVVSGKSDPVEPMYPQPPFHKCLFPISTQYDSFHLLSNPCSIEVPMSYSTKTKSNSMLNLILTDGEPIRDAMKYSDVKDPLKMSKRFLEWACICPTAPDTLPLHPGITKDPFIIEGKLPHLFIVGNQPEFKFMEWKGTKIVTLPQFSKEYTAVVFNKEHQFIPLQFNVLL